MHNEYPEVTRAAEELRAVLAVLEKAGDSYTQQLRGLLSDIENGNRFAAKEALYKAGGLCHPKCLGDIYLKDLTSAEWLSRLQRLEDACAAAFALLEKQ